MDPFLSGAVGGASAQVVKSAWDSLAQPWIDQYFERHLPAARAKAQANAERMFEDLATRMALIERQVVAQGQSLNTLNKQLEDPDFSAALYTATMAAARTNDPEKHALLSRAVAERLLSPPDDLRTLTTSLVLEAIPQLAPKHMDFLALASLIYHIRPTDLFSQAGELPIEDPAVKGKAIMAMYWEWLRPRMERIPLPTFSPLDYIHLMSVSCLKHDAFLSRDFLAVLLPPNSVVLSQQARDELQNYMNAFTFGTQILEVWKQGMQAITLTTTGQLLGVYVHDLRTGTVTTFQGW